MKVDHLFLPVPFHSDERSAVPHKVNTRARHKVKPSSNTAVFKLLEASLSTKVLGVSGVGRDPHEQPVVALVFAGYLQCDHVVSPEGYHGELVEFSQYGKPRSDSYEAEPCTKVRIVFQRSEEVC